ncbi:MAG: FKBP-type peptidyl-prolyl cis-trans isomerase [Chitinophagaceae bacterium]|nr:FKBP-type peptidyl-prolyl cis-trans isomerase [Chitinophagaceae bacterium]
MVTLQIYKNKRMKYFVLGLIMATTIVAGCGKTAETGCTPATPASERAAMVAYCSANNINFTEHSSGILYEIIAPGVGGSPNLSSTVNALYVGRLLDGRGFDSTSGNTTAQFSLANVIQGWQIGIPILKAGGRIKMVIPSSLAYSCVGVKDNNTGAVVIPPNSPLFFDVTLVSFR